MKHYSMAAWTDYLRGLTQESDRTEMARHLNTPCPVCGRVVALLNAVNESEPPVQVPDTLVARALAIFPKRPSAVERLVAALTFDSFAAASPQGARSLGASVRRLSFAAADMTVELVVEAPPGGIATLTGVCSATARDVQLLQQQRVLQTVPTSPFGEFHLQFAPRKGMHLLLSGLPGSRIVEVPLDFLIPLKQSGPKSNPTGSPRSSEKS